MNMTAIATETRVDFAWIELTNKCNLKCVHCYANSGPEAGQDDILKTQDYKEIISELADLGCRNIQFIGGEATIHKDLIPLIDHALEFNFDSIELYSNLLFLSPALKQRITENNISVATSFYSFDAKIHDFITKGTASWERTLKNMRYLIDAGVDLRVGFIEMEENQGHYEKTKDFLKNIGISDLSFDSARKFGRKDIENKPKISELCGQCATDVICISPTGLVSPCIMSKPWGIGNLTESTLEELINSRKLMETRELILEETSKANMGSCNPDCTPCTPKSGQNCPPKTNCHPQHRPNCSPKY